MISKTNLNYKSSNGGNTQQIWLNANTCKLLNNVRNSRFTTVETLKHLTNLNDLNHSRDNYRELSMRSPYIPLNEGYPLKPVFKRSVDPNNEVI